MFTILIIAALVVAVGSAGYGAVAYRNEQRRRGLGASTRAARMLGVVEIAIVFAVYPGARGRL